MPKKVEMKTVTQLRQEGYTTFTAQYINKLIADGLITGVEIVGKTHQIPLTKKNLKALKRERKEKTPRSS
jgi:hypothetical protein